MWLDNKSMQAALARLPWLEVGLAALLSVLLIASVFGVWKAFSTPVQIEEQVALVSYKHSGEFDYAVYVKPTHLLGSPPPETPEGEEEARPLYFRNIITDTNIEFTYQFVPDRPVTDVSTEADIVAIITGPSEWKKAYPLIHTTEQGNALTISFPLELEEFNKVINTIEAELGVRETDVTENVYDLVIEARVDVKANTGTERIEDTFVQPMKIKVGRGTLEWDNELVLSERKFHDGFSYKHRGNFDYTIRLKKNSLYGTAIILSPEPSQPSPVIRQPAGGVYFPRIIDIMKANFSYRFDHSRPVANLAEEVRVTAILECPGMWSKTFTLLPRTHMSGDFTVDFAVDINYFADMVDIIRKEIGMGAATQNLTIEAEVHTTADTESGHIDEVFTHTLEGRLETTTMTLSEELTKSQPGSITRNMTVPNPRAETARKWSLAALGVVILASLYVLWNYVRVKPLRLSPIETEFLRARKKHKNVMVDVQELPEAEAKETVIQLSSLDGLFKTADGLLKPVLHKAEPQRHTYCVIDGLTRYEYISET